jgi:hypothetical protein
MSLRYLQPLGQEAGRGRSSQVQQHIPSRWDHEVIGRDAEHCGPWEEKTTSGQPPKYTVYGAPPLSESKSSFMINHLMS